MGGVGVVEVDQGLKCRAGDGYACSGLEIVCYVYLEVEEKHCELREAAVDIGEVREGYRVYEGCSGAPYCGNC